MQLTPDQLDAAARNLCELWHNTTDEPTTIRLRSARENLIECLSMYPKSIHAIIHAVTSTQQNDEVSQ